MITVWLFLAFLLTPTLPGFCQTPVARQAELKVEQSIQVRQKAQKDRTQWELEKSKLVLQYEQLLHQKQILQKENLSLTARQTAQAKLNQALLRQKIEIQRIQKELTPFLKGIYERLKTLVTNDPPFLKEERTIRLVTLDKVIKDPEVTISEKYRKVMEALFIEAEYGSTIEVYQDKVSMGPSGSEGSEDILGNIFRLGRVSLFFLSLDQTACAVFNPGLKKWQALPEDYLPAICSAVEIGSKRRPVELLPLPLGRLATNGGDSE